MLKKILLASLVAASFVSVPLIASAQQRAIVITTEAPPPVPRQEAAPAPRRGFEWAPGYWAWRDGRHQWVSGRWAQERRGQQWVPERWVEKKTWVLEPGHWERRERNRDRDGDGVRNNRDAAPNNPNRQ